MLTWTRPNTWSSQQIWTLFFVGVLALIGLNVLPLRFDIVSQWHASAGDGLDYYSLSQELTRAGRFAYGPPPFPSSFSRLPGYPLFLSYLAVRAAPLPLDLHLLKATQANVVLDGLTAILIVLILRECRLGLRLYILRTVQATAFFVALCYPLLVLLSAYGLADTLATFLSTLEIYLALRAMRTRLFLHAVLCGLAAGAAQLTRVDALVALPPVVVALWGAATTRRRRLAAIALFGLTAALVFAPWPLRNLSRFGHLYPTGGYLRVRGDGQPMPGGIIAWAATWATGGPGETYLDVILTLRLPLGMNRLPPSVCDDAAECAEVGRVIDLYNNEGLSPRVDAGFVKLAQERRRRHPFRTFVTLPLRRLPNLWTPLPEHELPMRVASLQLPERRDVFGRCDLLLYLLTLWSAGVLLVQPEGRRLVVVVGLALLGRSVLYVFAVPNAVNQRYVVETIPLLIVIVATGISTVCGWLAPFLSTPGDESSARGSRT